MIFLDFREIDARPDVVYVFTLAPDVATEAAESAAAAWNREFPGLRAVFLVNGVTLDVLDDEQLAHVGLQRIADAGSDRQGGDR